MYASKHLPLLLLAFLFSLAALHPSIAAAQDGQGPPITSLTRAHNAVVHIVSIGAAWGYGEAQPSVEVGEGSGFIIDPAGIVVTNAHVVNGGNIFQVYLWGESKPHNAVLLGVSACDDLAVLDIRGSGFPYLLWQETPPVYDQAVYAAGYPDGEYAETKGRVQETDRSADTGWASVDQVIRHTAGLHPGSSGGPLLNRSGRVVGVNYAANGARSAFLAIPNDLAIPLVAQLAEGRDVDSIGINGIAFAESDDWFGIWVVAVESGSPADEAGIQPGDIIYSMEEIQLGYGGTVGTYCDILRSHQPGDALSFKAARGNELYVGQINGRPIIVRGEDDNTPTAASATGEETAGALSAVADAALTESTTESASLPAGYQLVADDTGIIRLYVPATWPPGASAKVMVGSVVNGPQYIIAAEPRADDIFAAGAVLVRVGFLGADSLDDELDLMRVDDDCTFAQRVDVRTEDFTGRADLWRECSGQDGWTAATAALRPVTDDTTTVNVTVTRLEQLISLETLIAPLGESLRARPIYWDIPRATVKAEILNVRSGPGADFDKRGQLKLDAEVTVLGKDSLACAWYYVLGGEVEGWISAAGEYSVLDRDCADLKVVTEADVHGFSFE